MAPIPPSGTGIDSRASYATGYFPNSKKLLFFTEYHFMPDGVAEITEKIGKALKAKELEIYTLDWSEKYQAFRVRCFAGDARQVALLFRTEIKDYVNKETAVAKKNEDEDEGSDRENGRISKKDREYIDKIFDPSATITSTKIQRLVVWKHVLQPTNPASEAESIELYSPRYFSALKIEESWSCVSDMISDFDLAELEQLTGCQFIKNVDEGKIVIGSNLQENFNLALSKLDNIRKYYTPPNSCHIYHLFYNEDDENVKLCLKLFKIIGRKYLKTTILDNVHVTIYEPASDFRNLHEATTIRAAPYNQLRSLFLPMEENYGQQQPVEVSDPNQSLKEWAQFKYQARGAEGQCPTAIYLRPAGPRTTSLVSRVATPPAVQIQKVTERAGPTEAIKRWQKGIPAVYLRPGETQPPKSPWEEPTLRPAWDKYVPHNEAALLKKMKRKEALPQPQTSKGLMSNLAVMKRAQSESVIPPPAINGSSRSDASSQSFPLDLMSSDAPDLSIPTPDFIDLAVKAPKSVCDLEGLLGRDLCLLDDDVSEYSNRLQEPLAPARCEHQQDLGEVATRTFHNTMAQFAPKRGSLKTRNPFEGRLETPDFSAPKKSPANKKDIEAIDPSPEFIGDINKAFAGMMNDLRGHRGELVLQAEFGRIVLRKFSPQRLTNKDVHNTYDADYVRKMLYNPTDFGPTCYFTPVLTTFPGEIPPILAMKNKSGQPLWDLKSPKWDVFYEFTFRDTRHSTRFTVEIDAEKFDTKVKTCREVANIFVHGTKRYNDYRIVAFGCERLDTKYGDLATALEASLWIPESQTEPCLYWTINSQMADRFVLDDVLVRRVCMYKSKDNKSILKVSELIALDTNGAWNDENTLIVFLAMPGPPDRRPWEKLNRWYEVAITSPEVDALLEQNKSLELGDEAGWTGESMSEITAAETFFDPACQMLKIMDDIGCRNDNGVPFAHIQEFPLPRLPNPPITRQNFW